MSYFKQIQIVDENNNFIEAHQDTDGEYYIGTAGIQSVHVDPSNSSTTNLAAANSYTFTGTGISTLGVAGLQWVLKTDQNATVYVEQSSDNTNWDISDSYDYKYSKGGAGGTVQAIGAYWRLRVALTGTTDTTYFRLNAILCPTVEAMPRSLDSYGRLITASAIEDAETGTHVDIEPLGSLKTITPIRLAGTGFDGTTKDTNFWTETVTGTGSIAQAGGATLSTGTTANSTAKYSSVRKARKVPGATNQFRSVARLTTDPQADNLRRIGAYDTNDGFFFQINGTTFGVGARKDGSDTVVTSGSFNGNYGASVTIDTTVKRLVIDYTAVSAKFHVDGILLHTITSNTDSSTNTLTLPVTMENINSNGNVTNNSFNVRFACILRLGEIETATAYKHISTSATTVCKQGAGLLRNVIVNNPTNATITIYDSNVASGTIIAIIDPDNGATPFDLTYGTQFSNGLTVVTAGTPDLTIIYE